jgi:hypothetical protein
MIPEGTIVAAKVISIEENNDLQFEGRPSPRLNWAFEITESPWGGYKILGSSSQKFTIDPPSKFYEWAVQLLGRTFEVGDGIDTEDLIGLPCRIEIEYKPDSRDPERMWMRPATVIGPRGSSKTAEDVFG